MAQKTLPRPAHAKQRKSKKPNATNYGVLPDITVISSPKPQQPAVSDTRPDEATASSYSTARTLQKKVVTFTSDDGTVYEIPDLPANLGRATAIASERNVRKIWGTQEEAQACHDMFGEK